MIQGFGKNARRHAHAYARTHKRTSRHARSHRHAGTQARTYTHARTRTRTRTHTHARARTHAFKPRTRACTPGPLGLGPGPRPRARAPGPGGPGPGCLATAFRQPPRGTPRRLENLVEPIANLSAWRGIIICAKCGAWAQEKPVLLTAVCTKKPSKDGLKALIRIELAPRCILRALAV